MAVSTASADGTALRRALELIRITAFRYLKVRYRGTALGVLWSFASPVLMTLLYTAIFGAAFASHYGSTSRYMLSAFMGVVVVTYFIQSTSEALTSVVGNGALLNKISVPREIFPLASVTANTFQQCVTTFPVVILLAAVLTHDPGRVVLVPVLLVALVALTVGFSLGLAAIFVFFRDLPHLWSLLSFVMWLSSPVFYPAEVVSPHIRAWLAVNPIAIVMTSLRNVAVERGAIEWAGVGSAFAVSIITLLIGAVLFRTLRDDFMDLL